MESMYSKKPSKGKVFLRVIGRIISIFIIVTVSIALYDMYVNINVDSEELPKVEAIETEKKEESSNDIYTVIEDVSKAVVGVSKLQSIDPSFFSLKAVQTYNLGTGVVIAKEGYVLTNSHVTGNMLSKCYITFENGDELTGNVVWVDENLDLSIIKVNTTRQIVSANLGDSDYIKVGQRVYAIGNPLGVEFQRTVTSGIISASDRTIKIDEDEKLSYMEELIQTDAPINNGNSGGPLIDEDGNILGITTVKINEAEGIGFAVHINIVKPIIDKLIETGKFEEASIGVYGYDKEAIKYLNSSLEIENGIYVEELVINGAAKKAGIKEGDIIEEVDGIKLNKLNDLRKYIYTKEVGDEVKAVVLRGKERIELNIKLQKK